MTNTRRRSLVSRRSLFEAGRYGLLVFTTAAFLAACSGEDRPEVDIIVDGEGGGSGSVSVSGVDGPGIIPTRIPGSATYQTVSNVDIYFAMGADLRDIRTIMQPATQSLPVDWAAASAIYEQGKNQKRADGTLRSLASIANADVHAMFPNGPAVYGSADFINDILRGGLTGTGSSAGLSDDARRNLVDKGVLMLMYGKALQELEAAKTRIAEGNRDDATGAPHAVDEAWAVILGPQDNAGGYSAGLIGTALGRESNFGFQNKIAIPLETEFAKALDAARKGDAAAFDAAHTQIRGYLNTIFYLGTLRYTTELVNDQMPQARQVHLVEGGTFFQAIRALVASASPTAAQTVQSAYSASPDAAFPASLRTGVYAAMNEPPVLAALGIPAGLVVMSPPQ
jgi:hypothetical protein